MPVEEARAGDIVGLAGLTVAETVADTIADPVVTQAIHAQPDRDALRRRQFAARGARGQQGDEPHDPRPPDARGQTNVAIKVTEAADRDSSRWRGAANCSSAC
ncbi:hypothetical protein AB5I41_02750 [Sphingomonas sp. MMS24-JH45]